MNDFAKTDLGTVCPADYASREYYVPTIPGDLRVSHHERNEDADSPFGRGMAIYFGVMFVAIVLALIGYYGPDLVALVKFMVGAA